MTGLITSTTAAQGYADVSPGVRWFILVG